MFRRLYNRWIFFVIGLAGLANALLLVYRFSAYGFASHVTEHVTALIFSVLTCTLALSIFADLTMRKPKDHK